MFRKMRRFKQETTKEECVRILKEERRGTLSLIGENGYPYGIPLNFIFDEETEKIYFHGAREGHKIDALKKCNKVCFSVHDEGYIKEGDWCYNVTSVVIFGTIRFMEADEGQAYTALNALLKKYYPTDAFKAAKEDEPNWPKAQMLELTIDHMTGKLVEER